MLRVLNVLIHDVYQKIDKNCIKALKFGNFWYFRGHFSHSQKSSKISTNTYRMKLTFWELNSLGNTLEV